jgi:hypothetical protein
MKKKFSTALIKELCQLLSEECAEVTQRASKLSRFGHKEIQPGQPLNNFERLRREKVDLLVVFDLLQIATGNEDPESPRTFRPEWHKKQDKLVKYAELSVSENQLSQLVLDELKECVALSRKEKVSLPCETLMGRCISTANGPAVVGEYDHEKGKYYIAYDDGGVGYLE